MSREMSFYYNGKIVAIERFEDETDVSFAERSSFILNFVDDDDNYKLAIKLSFYHIKMMFYGVLYDDKITQEVVRLRNLTV